MALAVPLLWAKGRLDESRVEEYDEADAAGTSPR